MTLTTTVEPGARKKKAVMPPRLRKLVLVTHVTASLGWVGAVVVFLTISMIALSTDDITTMRGIYLVMEPIAWYVLVPLSFVSLITGIIQGLGTQYGLFRQYWVLYKLVITAFSTVILLIFASQSTSMFADWAASEEAVEMGMLPTSNPYQHAMLALAGLLVATVLGIYKPRGLTPFGKREASRKQRITWTVVAAGIVGGLVIVSEVSPVNPLQEFMQLIPAPGGGGGGGGGEGGSGGGH
jgi:hypothetical protein